LTQRVNAVAERSDQQARLLESVSAFYPPDSSLNRIVRTRGPVWMPIVHGSFTAEPQPEGWRLGALITEGPALPFNLVCAVTLPNALVLKKNFPTVSVDDEVHLLFPADFGLASDQLPSGTATVDWQTVHNGLFMNLSSQTFDLAPARPSVN